MMRRDEKFKIKVDDIVVGNFTIEGYISPSNTYHHVAFIRDEGNLYIYTKGKSIEDIAILPLIWNKIKKKWGRLCDAMKNITKKN